MGKHRGYKMHHATSCLVLYIIFSLRSSQNHALLHTNHYNIHFLSFARKHMNSKCSSNKVGLSTRKYGQGQHNMLLLPLKSTANNNNHNPMESLSENNMI